MQSGPLGKITTVFGFISAGTQICHASYSTVISLFFFIVSQLLFWPHAFLNYGLKEILNKDTNLLDYDGCTSKDALMGSLMVFSLLCLMAVFFDILHIFCGFCEPITFVISRILKPKDGRSFSSPFEAGCTGCMEFVKILILTGQFIFLILMSIYTISPLSCVIRIDILFIITKIFVVLCWIGFIIQICLIVGCSCCVSSGEEFMMKRAIQKKNENK